VLGEGVDCKVFVLDTVAVREEGGEEGGDGVKVLSDVCDSGESGKL
jgi:hypothetical protein